VLLIFSILSVRWEASIYLKIISKITDHAHSALVSSLIQVFFKWWKGKYSFNETTIIII
jgi:hypothetical protein